MITLKKKNKGFTLVELLAVIVILAIVISLATGGVIAILNKSREKLAEEVRQNFKEAALSYALDNSYPNKEKYYLEKCSLSFSEELLKGNISNLNNSENASCILKVSKKNLTDLGLFEDARGFCLDTDVVVIYRYDDGVNSEYKAYVSDTICKN